MAKKPIGPTGAYPRGKYTKDDEGELAIAIAADPRNCKVRIEFGKPIAWLALNPDEAEALAQALIAKACDARGKPIDNDDWNGSLADMYMRS